MKPYTWRQAIIRSELPATTRHVLLTLACHINDAGESAYPSIDLLAFETSLSRRAVISHLQAATALGWIRTSKHGFAGQKWARNEYDPRIPDGFVPLDPPSKRAPEGGEPNDKKVVNESNRLSKKVVNVVPEGGEPDDKKVVNHVHSNRPIELSIEQTTLSAHAESRSPKKSEGETDIDFEEAWKAYPKRDGGNPKAAALKAWKARLREGIEATRLVAATRGYAAAMLKAGNVGTRFVLQASTFFGPDRRFAEFAPRDDEAGDAGPTEAPLNWWQRAGFDMEWKAINAGCSEKYAFVWRSGVRMTDDEIRAARERGEL